MVDAQPISAEDPEMQEAASQEAFSQHRAAIPALKDRACAAQGLGKLGRMCVALVSVCVLSLSLVSTAAAQPAPAARGSHTVTPKSSGVLSYDVTASSAKQKGSVQGQGVDDKQGWGCPNNQQWVVLKGEIRCAEKLTFDTGAAELLTGGKTLYVRSLLVAGFISGPLMRITGTENELRVDMFALNGGVVSSCFITKEEPSCHLGSPNNAHPGLAAVAQFASTGGQLRWANELVAGNLVFAGSTAGGSLQDAYIATVTSSQTHLDVHIAGLYYLDGSQGEMLRPIYSFGRIYWSALNGRWGGLAEAQFTTTSAWNANTP